MAAGAQGEGVAGTGIAGEEGEESMTEMVKVEADPNVAQVVVGHVAEYRSLHEQIDALEARAQEQRAAVCELLTTDGVMPGTMWEFPPVGVVKVVKGRVTERLDRAKLARLGVSAEVLDAATVKVEGNPSVRIEGWRDAEEEAS